MIDDVDWFEVMIYGFMVLVCGFFVLGLWLIGKLIELM